MIFFKNLVVDVLAKLKVNISKTVGEDSFPANLYIFQQQLAALLTEGGIIVIGVILVRPVTLSDWPVEIGLIILYS